MHDRETRRESLPKRTYTKKNGRAHTIDSMHLKHPTRLQEEAELSTTQGIQGVFLGVRGRNGDRVTKQDFYPKERGTFPFQASTSIFAPDPPKIPRKGFDSNVRFEFDRRLRLHSPPVNIYFRENSMSKLELTKGQQGAEVRVKKKMRERSSEQVERFVQTSCST